MSPIRIHGHGGQGAVAAPKFRRGAAGLEDRRAPAEHGTFVALTGTHGLDTVAKAVRQAFPGKIAEVDFSAALRVAAK